MREEFIEIYPTFKLIVSGNHRPDIRGGDDGIWRRVLLVPFEVQIPKDRVRPAIAREAVGRTIGHSQLVDPGRTYLEEGAEVPDAVRAATDDYREQSDPYGAFLKGACRVTGDDADVETPGELYSAFKRFCERQGFSHCLLSPPSTRCCRRKAAAFGPQGQEQRPFRLSRHQRARRIQVRPLLHPVG